MSWKASAWAKEQRLGSPSAKSILMCLADYADPDGVIKGWASQSELSASAEVSERTAREWLQRLEEWGLVERRRQQRPNGARAADWIVLRLDRTVTDGSERCRTLKNSDGEESLPADSAGRTYRQPDADPTGNQAHPTGNQFRAYKDNPPIEPPLPSQSARAGAREREGDSGEEVDRSDVPGTAPFEKRVMRFCNGRGYVAGPWKDWDTSSPGWIAKQFAKLTSEERAEAERWRDAYLVDIAGRGKEPVVVGNFLSGKLWTGLDPALLDRIEKRRTAQLAPEDRPQPDGWAKCLGPIGMAWLFGQLLAGPADPARTTGAILIRADLVAAWPTVADFAMRQRGRGGAIFGNRWHERRELMEAAPKGSAVWEAWRAEFDARRWPWLPVFDELDVLWAPKGGPAALDAFDAAIRNEAKDHDGGGREAAE